MSRPVYLDHVAGAPLRPSARRAATEALDAFGDPESVHAEGRRARAILDRARERVAERLGAGRDEIVFTSGGTEAVNLAVRGAALAGRGRGNRIVVTAVEGWDVLESARNLRQDGVEVTELGVDGHGRVDMDRYAAAVAAEGTVLASVQYANREVGTLQPVAEAVRLARAVGALLHSDVSYAIGHVPVDAERLGADLLSFSGHLLGGPPGAGVLYVRRGVSLTPLIVGDDRERKRRAGRPGLAAVAGLAAALDEASETLADEAGRLWDLSERLRGGITERVDGAVLHGHPTWRVPHIVCFSVPGVEAEAILMALDERGFRLGTGATCPPSGVEEASHVLRAMGHLTAGTVRAGLGPETTAEDVDGLLQALPPVVAGLRRMATASGEAMARLGGSPDGKDQEGTR